MGFARPLDLRAVAASFFSQGEDSPDFTTAGEETDHISNMVAEVRKLQQQVMEMAVAQPLQRRKRSKTRLPKEVTFERKVAASHSTQAKASALLHGLGGAQTNGMEENSDDSECEGFGVHGYARAGKKHKHCDGGL